MTNQQPQFTIAELGAKFGAQLGQIYSELITLEKVIESQQAQIQKMTNNENRLVDHVQDLEDELTLLKSENFELQQMAETQQAETKDPPRLSPKSQELAEASRAIIQGDPSN
jgi:predicted  nucleic acid-binding Zn-ribbon protein